MTTNAQRRPVATIPRPPIAPKPLWERGTMFREPEPPALEPPTPSRGSNSDRSRQAALAKARAERANQTSSTALQHTA